MLRTFTCIMCPQGCDITAELAESGKEKQRDGSGNGPVIQTVSGNRCRRGLEYVTQEIENPMRNIATSVLVDGGELPLASVRLTRPIPKCRIFDVMEEIKKVRRTAPVREGQVVIADVLGLGSDVIITKTVEKQSRLEEE
ncbi:MAG: DUF1667 domain-containing protein [Lachnospiraceae bacterium]|nr:DUF1667 domain-containing protein [Lachnospiraceae bacterium]